MKSKTRVFFPMVKLVFTRRWGISFKKKFDKNKICNKGVIKNGFTSEITFYKLRFE